MSKKQMILLSFIAAIPGAILLAFLVMGLLQGMLSDTATVKVTLWIVWVLAATGSAAVAFLPFALMFFPGLMPVPAAAADASGGAGVGASASRKSAPSVDDEEGEDYEPNDGESEFNEDSEYSESGDDGEQLFDNDALDDDFDDDLGDSFDEKKKKR